MGGPSDGRFDEPSHRYQTIWHPVRGEGTPQGPEHASVARNPARGLDRALQKRPKQVTAKEAFEGPVRRAFRFVPNPQRRGFVAQTRQTRPAGFGKPEPVPAPACEGPCNEGGLVEELCEGRGVSREPPDPPLHPRRGKAISRERHKRGFPAARDRDLASRRGPPRGLFGARASGPVQGTDALPGTYRLVREERIILSRCPRPRFLRDKVPATRTRAIISCDKGPSREKVPEARSL
ncbi:hypothetical protein M885DRAFT_206442 [Pelagophyceae sp. CCMP2097]|nr:hypothetical protein M885DRAFT_206442 [Pelagophyceae sp. CCMP2097]